MAAVVKFLWDPFVKPITPRLVGENLVRLTGRTIALAAVSAITSAVLNKYSKQEGPLPAMASQFLKASLFTAATSAAVLICYIYRAIQTNKDFSKAHRDTARFEKIIAYSSALARLSTILASAVFRRNETVISIDRYSRFPLMVCSMTAMVISLFHQHQMKKL